MAAETPQLRDILHLLTIPGFGAGRVRRLLTIFNSTEEVLRAPLQRLMQVDGIDRKLAMQIKTGGNQGAVDEQLSKIKSQNIGVLTIWDNRYPALLKSTFDPPLVIFYKGELPESWPPAVAVVGTRNPSSYGKRVVERLVGDLIHNGIAIISGLARGIDTMAHRTAIERGGTTYAVLGCGLDCIYPPENRKLFEEITHQGLLLSEFFLGTGPDSINFPRRNRIISGMSLGTLVIEAGDKSGALITANYAVDQNREVFAVPGNINSPKSAGTNRLIQQGAKLVNSVQDILDEISPGLIGAQPVEKTIPEHLPPFDRRLLEHLSGEPIHIDRLVLELKESPAKILAALLNLELSGLVRQLSGKMFIRI
ncbi:MAG: DNA-processing protein DprA [Calditrichia bacterium]